ncbi:unnamed protein product [Cyprideis torosa]|uniref:Uncharacterized protein n=1 Tax=Cyprideis torosa TaxID=163714 RepID=A0A7R8WDN4_9CRUS|nr:unnamed protein product [Cyprideis torosa]CAG0891975.1 unnamed protein product [Cyprideis torosa]
MRSWNGGEFRLPCDCGTPDGGSSPDGSVHAGQSRSREVGFGTWRQCGARFFNAWGTSERAQFSSVQSPSSTLESSDDPRRTLTSLVSQLEELRRTQSKRPPVRCLFGAADPAENAAFLKREWEKLHQEMKERWNFDFQTGHPLGGRYEWQPASVDRVPCRSEGGSPREEEEEQGDEQTMSWQSRVQESIDDESSLTTLSGTSRRRKQLCLTGELSAVFDRHVFHHEEAKAA